MTNLRGSYALAARQKMINEQGRPSGVTVDCSCGLGAECAAPAGADVTIVYGKGLFVRVWPPTDRSNVSGANK